MPRVSIILPTYKRQELLKKAIESVWIQDYSDWELVIVNDGDDLSKDLIIDYANKDPRIKYVFMPKNSGCVSIPRNIGILYSNGEYICPLDDDIIMLPCRLKTGVYVLDNYPKHTLVYGTQLRQNLITGRYDMINIPDFNPLSGWGIDNNQIMYRRSIYDKVKITFPRRACDWELMKDIWTEYPNSFGMIADVVSIYHWHGDNRSLDDSTKTKDIHPEDFKDWIKWHLVKKQYNIDWNPK